MNVFISYGGGGDQVTALRLQALGAVNGLTVYVPPAYTRETASAGVDYDAAGRIGSSDVILGLVGDELSDACRQELNAGLAQGKPMIVMSERANADFLGAVFGSRLVLIDPARPDRTESQIVEQLKTIDAGQRAKNALLVMGTLALGMFLFEPAEHR